MIDVRTNQRELQIESKSTSASCIRLMDSVGGTWVSAVPRAARKWGPKRRTILVQLLIVLAHGHQEHDGRHVLEAVDPAKAV